MVLTHHQFVCKIALFSGCLAIQAVFLDESSQNLAGLMEHNWRCVLLNDVIMVVTHHRFVRKVALFFGCHSIQAVFLDESSQNLAGLMEHNW